MPSTGNPNWKKGVSGNPGGRPKGLALAIRQRFGDGGERIIKELEHIAFVQKKVATRDRIRAMEVLLERGWGTPTQVVAGDPDAPIGVKVMFGGRYHPNGD